MAKQQKRPWDMHYRSRVEKKTGDVIVTLWWWHVVREHVYDHRPYSDLVLGFSRIIEPQLLEKPSIQIRVSRDEWCGECPNEHYNAYQVAMRKLLEAGLQSDLASYSQYASAIAKHIKKHFGSCRIEARATGKVDFSDWGNELIRQVKV